MNEKTIGKLANQVDFLNKENHTLQQQVAILKGDKQAIKTLENYKTEIENLSFDNQSLRKDVSELTRILNEHQQRELDLKQKDLELANQEETLNKKLEQKVAVMSVEQERLKCE